MVFKLMEGFQNHHKISMPNFFKSKAGAEAKNDEENAKILNEHFHTLFNSQVEIDPTVLDEPPQCNINHTLGNIPSKSEIKDAIKQWPTTKLRVSQAYPPI
jgi:hypothetical protein